MNNETYIKALENRVKDLNNLVDDLRSQLSSVSIGLISKWSIEEIENMRNNNVENNTAESP